ncbi:hypothetical protein PQX77_001329 [Marasmius sp. AFHP31]|nr:hypothetical protein PQX77_001329 [Marasmius sp. AFHP31]
MASEDLREPSTSPTNDSIEEPTWIPFMPADARDFLQFARLAEQVGDTGLLWTPSESVNGILSRLKELAEPRSQTLFPDSTPPPFPSSPLPESSSPPLPSSPFLPPSSPPPQPSSPPPQPSSPPPPQPSTPPPLLSRPTCIFSDSPLSPAPPTPLHRTSSPVSPTPLKSVRFFDGYDSDTSLESPGQSDDELDDKSDLYDWFIEQATSPGSPSYVTDLKTGKLMAPVAQSLVQRLRGGVWTDNCPRNSAPLNREAIVVDANANAEGNLQDEEVNAGEGNDDINQSVRNNWMLKKGKKGAAEPKSSVTYVMMFELYQKSVTVNQPDSWADYMVDAFDQPDIDTYMEGTTPATISLAAAAEKIFKGDARERAMGFKNMLAIINFRVRVESIMRSRRIDRATVYGEYLEEEMGKKVSYGTFCRWVNVGTIFCELAGAGSVYLLFLLAAARLRSRFNPLQKNDTSDITKAFRQPDADDVPLHFGSIVKNVYIPAISSLRKRLSLVIPSAIPPECRQQYCLPYDLIDCTNLDIASRYFCCLHHNGWRQVAHDESAWGMFELDPIAAPPNTILIDSYSVTRLFTAPVYQTLQLDQPSAAQSSVVCVTVNTQFDPTDPHNKFPCDRDMPSRLAWTLRRRALLPGACVRPTTLQEFVEKVGVILSPGYRIDPDLYLYYDGDQLDNQALDIRDRNGETIALIGYTIPRELITELLAIIQGLFPELQPTDSSLHPTQKFKCSHLTLYNRYHTKGDDAPNDAAPWDLQKEGKRPCNIKQFTPRFATEFYEQETRGTRLLNAMRPALTFLASVVKARFPKENGELIAFISGLPLDAASPVHPFGGVAVNINAATIVHLDPMDLNLCLVLAIHDCTGGELVLEGPGIVIKLKSGDFTIFPSKRYSHYNLDFKGLRVSFAFSTDQAAKQWIEDNNGWLGSTYMRSSRT